MKRNLYFPVFIILLFFGTIIGGCGGGGGGSAPVNPGNPSPQPADTTPPHALTVTGENSGNSVSLLKIAFDEPLNPLTVNQSTVTLNVAAGAAVPATIGCVDPCKVIDVTPGTPLQFNVDYTVAIKGVADLAGNALPAMVVLSFNQPTPDPGPGPGPGSGSGPVDSTPPHFKTISPINGASGIAEGTPISLTFDENIALATVTSNTFRVVAAGETIPVAGTYACGDIDCSLITFTPAAQLHFSTAYQITVTSGITDIAGNPLANPTSGTFTVRSKPVVTPLGWTKQMGNNFNQNFYAVEAVSPQKAWAVGERGLIIYTSDGGAHWTLQETGTFQPLYGIDLVNEQVGYAVGGAAASGTTFANVIFKTSDGGTSWTSQTAPAIGGVLKSVRFIDAQKGWAVGGGGAILATTDGGAHWNAQNSGVTTELTTVDFVDANHGWTTGGGKVLLITSNGGAQWSPAFTFSTSIRAIDFIDAQRGWAVGDAGTLLFSVDGGASWNAAPVTSTITVNLTAVKMVIDPANPSGVKGWAVADAKTILYFNGTSWSAQPLVAGIANIAMFGVSTSDGATGLAVGGLGEIFLLTSGATPVIANAADSVEIFTPFFVDKLHGWSVGLDARAFLTTDGGKNWKQTITDWRTQINWTHIVSPARTCAATETPVLTSGKYQCMRENKVHLFDVFFLNAQKGWAVGLPSLILYTEDGGQNWTEQALDVTADCPYDRDTGCSVPPIYFRRVQFTDDQNGWVVGRFRVIYKTTDGGKSWQELNINWKFPTKDGTCTTTTLKKVTVMGGHLFGLSVAPLNPNDVWVGGGCCGDCNPLAIIAHTTDGGLTWQIQTSYNKDPGNPSNSLDPNGLDPNGRKFLPEGSRFRQIQMIGDHGWAVGSGGIFLRTDDHGESWKQVQLGTKTVMLLDLFFIDALRGWIAGEYGQLFKTEDGGLTWRSLQSGTRNELTNVRFLNPDEGWLSGSGELILHATNGG